MKQSVLSAFIHAFRGIKRAFQKERNFRIQASIAFLSLIVAKTVGLNSCEFSIILLLVGSVLAFEMINTGIETLCDHIHPSEHTQIALVKDLSAGAVLWMSILSFIIGLLLFLPKLNRFLKELL